MVNNNSEFLLNPSTLRLVIYASLIVGNFLFALLHPVQFKIDLVGLLSFLLY
jgi:hypothetical protein